MSRSAGPYPAVLDRPASRNPRPAWRTVNITPVERLGRMAVGLAAVVAGIVMLRGAGSALARRGGRYPLARQGLLALRDQPRRWSLALPVTLAGAVIALIADILIAAAR